MNKTKKNFLKVGSILSIIGSSLMLILGILGLIFIREVNETFLLETYKNDSDAVVIEFPNGSYIIEIYEDGVLDVTLTQADLKLASDVIHYVGITALVLIIGISVSVFVLSIKILKSFKYSKVPKGFIIANLVLSILMEFWITAVCMIVALCIKDNLTPNLKNINEIANENGML